MTETRRSLIGGAASWPTEFVLAAGYAAVVAGCLLAAVAVPAAHTEVRIGVVAVALGVYAAWAAHLVASLCIAVLAWCTATAFLVNHDGELTLQDTPGFVRLAVLLAVAALGSALARAVSAADHAADR